ncbi:MAG: TIGR01777 family protein [Crocinitomicaceae bacterium]|nr:TIGR01777 family protein [Crocinitomicaceae bacterium]
METILITGGSGMIGSALIPKLLEMGYRVRVLSRSKQPIEGVEVFTWDVDQETIETGALAGVDHIIHLAGYDVSSGRWTNKRKQLIYDSRIKSIHVLRKHLNNQKINAFISASGVSIYGTVTTEKIFTEDDVPESYDDNDFLAKVSKDWEAAADLFSANADRVVKVRTPVVLSRSGGALERIAKPVKMGVGVALGSGKQYVPWVHIDDLVQFYIKSIADKKFEGPYNVVAPDHVTNNQLTQAIAHALNKKIWLPNAPSFVLKLMFGQMANIVLKGSRVSSEKLLRTGFEFDHSELNESVKNLMLDR